MTDREEFEKWWESEFNCAEGYGAFEAWQARGALDAVRVKEPIGYVDEFGNFEFTMQMWMEEEPNVTWTPVYTTPPSREWVGLSDAEIEGLDSGNQGITLIARAIEQALKEKNG